MITENRNYDFSFRGKGSEYFGVLIVNWLLTIVTLGIYYPWTKARTLKYLYENTYLEQDNFKFSGTGKEMFKGFIKVFGLFVIMYILMFISAKLQIAGLAFVLLIVFYAIMLLIIPYAIHGFLRYRTSRTSWRGIRFGYTGDRKTLVKIYLKGALLTLLTFGIYGSWMITEIRNYTISNIHFGNAKFNYKANGGDFFLLNLKGIFLTYITLGIYGFWYQRDILRFYFDHLSLHKDDQKVRFTTYISVGEIFELAIINGLLIVFTLGLAYPFAQVRTLTKVFEKLQINGNINLDELYQTQEEYKNAFGDEALDVLDISNIF